MAQCQGPRAHAVRVFFALYPYLEERCCEIPKVPGAPSNVNPALAITWLVGVAIYYTFFNNNSPPPCQFLPDKIRLKKKKN